MEAHVPLVKDVQDPDVLFTSKAIPHSLKSAMAAGLARDSLSPSNSPINTQNYREQGPSPGALPTLWPSGPRANTTLHGLQRARETGAFFFFLTSLLEYYCFTMVC